MDIGLSIDGMRPEVHSFPVADSAFRVAVLAALKAALIDDGEAPPPDLDAAQTAIRERYPNALLVPRDDMGGYETRPVWYAFRDGRVRPRSDDRERLYASLTRARESTERAEEVLNRSAKVAREAGYR